MEVKLETVSAKVTIGKAAYQMLGLNLLAAAIAIWCAGPVLAQRDDGMETQRCVWRCLANSSGNQDPAYQACVDRVCIPKQRSISPPPRPTTQRQAQSCTQTAGRAKAQELVHQCLGVSEVTHPSCRAENSCSLIVDEIKRSCGIKQNAGIGVPIFCDQFPAVELVREIQLLLNALGYEPGPVDGQLGEETRRALQRFQRVSNLPSTGEPTLTTTTALREAYHSQGGGLTTLPGSIPSKRDPSAGQATNKAGNQVERPSAPVQVPTTDNGYQWISSDAADGNIASLLYGVPGTDDLLISFICERSTRTLVVGYFHEPLGARNGLRVNIELSSQNGKVLLSAIGQRLMMNDEFRLEARTNGLAIGKVLAGGRSLSIRVQKSVIRIPLLGAESGITELITACT